MPNYDYVCHACHHREEIFHSMSDETPHLCTKCGETMIKQIGTGYLASKGFKPSLEDIKEEDHAKKVKDPERALKSRRKAFGSDSVGDPVDKPDPKHIIKGKTLGGQQKEVDKKEFIQAAAKDPLAIKLAQDALRKSKKK